MATFERCPKDVDKLAAKLIGKFSDHQSLRKYEVTVDYLFARSEMDEHGNPKGPALKHHGYAARGVAKINSLEKRVLGNGDAQITLDGDWWEKASPAQRAALLDHELHHLEVVEEQGSCKRDDFARPKLAMRKHDFDFGWFNVIAERHGVDSLEVTQAATIVMTAGQLYFPGMEKGKLEYVLKDADEAVLTRPVLKKAAAR